MSYDHTKDPFHTFAGEGVSTYGQIGAPITKSDTVDLAQYAKAIVVTTAGDLRILPVMNADDVPISFIGAPVGFVPPYRVRRVFATGTTAVTATVEE